MEDKRALVEDRDSLRGMRVPSINGSHPCITLPIHSLASKEEEGGVRLVDRRQRRG